MADIAGAPAPDPQMPADEPRNGIRARTQTQSQQSVYMPTTDETTRGDVIFVAPSQLLTPPHPEKLERLWKKKNYSHYSFPSDGYKLFMHHFGG